MINLDISDIRTITKMHSPKADFESLFNFYYDETNNIRKFSLTKTEFNNSFTKNFLLGGLVYEGTRPDIKALFDKLRLQTFLLV